MASLLSQFISDHSIKSQVDAQVASILTKSSTPLAVGLSGAPDPTVKDAIGLIGLSESVDHITGAGHPKPHNPQQSPLNLLKKVHMFYFHP
jgi:hypothetical protein